MAGRALLDALALRVAAVLDPDGGAQLERTSIAMILAQDVGNQGFGCRGLLALQVQRAA